MNWPQLLASALRTAATLLRLRSIQRGPNVPPVPVAAPQPPVGKA